MGKHLNQVGGGEGDMEGFPEKVISDLNLQRMRRSLPDIYELGKEHSRPIRLGVLFSFSPEDEKGNCHV